MTSDVSGQATTAGDRRDAGPHRPKHEAEESNRGPGQDEAHDRTRVVLRPFASPLPLGLFAFAVGNLLLAVAHLGGFGPEDVRTTMVMLATFVAVPQFVAAVFGFLTREPLVATLLGLLSVSWPTDLVVQEFTGRTTDAPRGVFYLALAGVLVLLALPGLRSKPLFSVVLAAAVVRFAAGGLYDLTAAPGWQRVSGAVAIAVAASAAYLAFALLMEDVRHRTVLPVGRVSGTESAAAMEGGFEEQTRSLPQEAGVRAQL